MTHVKICCIQSPEEAALAARYGAHALGLVSRMPTGPGTISEDRIREVAGAMPRGVRGFLLTCQRDPEAIAEQVREVGIDTVQLVDRMTVDDLGTLRRALPETSLVQVVHVTGAGSIAEAESMAPHVDALLLDSGTPDAEGRTLGGTGRVHDWDTSAEIVERVPVPVFLAGGLSPENVGEAIRHVRPYGVDVCSRLRPRVRLDEGLLGRFFEEVRQASRSAW